MILKEFNQIKQDKNAMKYTKLHNDMQISRVSLGTMLWGGQVEKQDAYEQMELSLELGINHWDTAEVYTVPVGTETYGSTERIIGSYFRNHPEKRDKVFVSTKMATGPFSNWIRHGEGKLKTNIIEAVDGSLERMNLDCLGIFQIHYPTRNVNFNTITKEELLKDKETILNTIVQCNELIKVGKIMGYGLGNDTAWGVSKFCSVAEKHDLIQPVTVQNEYNLLKRNSDINLAEACIREEVFLLAFSPLAGGLLTGKYLQQEDTENNRFNSWSKHKKGQYIKDIGIGNKLIQDYVTLAQDNNLTPAQLALSWNMHRKFIGSTIVAGTKLSHLENNIKAIDMELTQDILDEIDDIHTRYL